MSEKNPPATICQARMPGLNLLCGAPSTESIGDYKLCRSCFLDEHPGSDIAFKLECHAEVIDEPARQWILAAARRLRAS